MSNAESNEPAISSSQKSQESRTNYFQIDILKTIAIALVVLDHSLTWELKHDLLGPFWERTAIPLFLIIMGFNMGLSFKHRKSKGEELGYTLEYNLRKTIRYIFPFVLLYVVLLTVAFNRGAFLDYTIYPQVGYLPFAGPGSWFIPVLFTSILVFPFIFIIYSENPKLAVALCFLSEISIQLVLFIFFPTVDAGGFYTYESFIAGQLSGLLRVNILFLLPAVGLGLWFTDGHGIREKRNRLMCLAVPLSLLYMIAFQFFDFRFQIFVGDYKYGFITGDYTFLVYPYSAMLFLLAMKFLPEAPRTIVGRLVQKFGKATYHILLTQILYYAIIYYYRPNFADIGFGTSYTLHAAFFFVNLMITFGFGVVWYELEHRIQCVDQPISRKLWICRAIYLVAIFVALAAVSILAEIIAIQFGFT
ncbi:MAG: acyltransferase family protein, partial [Candidatus Thorarchaeota archaeon]